jgi:hypothetical protein
LFENGNVDQLDGKVTYVFQGGIAMKEETHRIMKTLLGSTEPDALRMGLKMVSEEINRVGPDEAEPLLGMISAMFYIDPLDRPDLVPLLDEAVNLVSGFGEWVIPVLVENLDAGDLKAKMAVAHALGRIGVNAITSLIAQYRSSADPGRRTFILYALGKIKSPGIVEAAPLALEAAESSDRELRDTAIRAIGKFAESIPPSQLSEELHRQFVEKLHGSLADLNPGIRAKAVRALGKMARCGHLNTSELGRLKESCHAILGTNDKFEWDRAFIVRKEAEGALEYV